ncbi:MAG TPA: response regulator [Blastocatellia bacterium]|nr:response regulator [Blastocatellia bacterium]
MKLRTLLIDDEASARSRLAKLLAAHTEIVIVAEAADGIAALEQIEEAKPDLIFLDVQMPGLTGFELLRALPPEAPLPLVIFATAYDQYALDAFEANAVSYLLKPINRERLAQAVERACKLKANDAQTAAERDRLRQLTAAAPPLQQIVARRRDRFVLLPMDQICCFELSGGTLHVKTETDSYWTDYQINDLEARLPDPPFFRAHRSAIVNLQKVKEIAPLLKSSFLLVLNDQAASEIQVSERQSKKLRQLLQGL